MRKLTISVPNQLKSKNLYYLLNAIEYPAKNQPRSKRKNSMTNAALINVNKLLRQRSSMDRKMRMEGCMVTSQLLLKMDANLKVHMIMESEAMGL